MKTAVEIENQIRAKAEEDDAFRAKLVEDPKNAIHEATGLEVPESFNIHIHEESPTDFHLVLPPTGGRVSDAELRGVAGGAVTTKELGEAW